MCVCALIVVQVNDGSASSGLPAKAAFESIGGYAGVKAALNRLIVSQFADPASAARLGVQPTSGVLLSGPTGCGKTLFAQQLATAVAAFGVSFISIKPTEVFSKYLGDSEKTLRVRTHSGILRLFVRVSFMVRTALTTTALVTAGCVSPGARGKSVCTIH